MSMNYHKIYRRFKKKIKTGFRLAHEHSSVFFERFSAGKYQKEDERLNDNVYLYYWKYNNIYKDAAADTENLGDYLSPVVVGHFAPKGQSRSRRPVTLYAIGSIIGLRRQNAVVWGSGILCPTSHRVLRIKESALDIRAVRGPETRKELLKIGKNCPEVYGDPAVLMPLIYQPGERTKKYKTTIIFNYGDSNKEVPAGEEGNVFDTLTKDYQSVIDRIVQSETVISSSLHGIILSEAYGVPAILLRQENQDLFKFKDWYYSTGRKDFPTAESIRQALEMTPVPPPDLSDMQNDLIHAFPTDLW